MDPITMLLTALAAGAAAAAQDTASQAVKDAYTALKERVQDHFAGNHQADGILLVAGCRDLAAAAPEGTPSQPCPPG